MKKTLLILLILSMSVSAGAATVIADSATDWANNLDYNDVAIQGHPDTSGLGQWYYGYYDGDVSGAGNWTPADFEQMTSIYTWGIWQAVPGTYALLGQAFVHPDNSYVPVRRWVSGVDGDIVITGSVSRQATDTSCTLLQVFVDNELKLSQVVTSSTPIEMNSSFSVTKGSVIDFAVHAYDGMDNDGTNFHVTISTPEPEPAAIVADSSTDWAKHTDSNGVANQGHWDTSGLGQWYYGYYDGDVSGGANWTPVDFEQTTSLYTYGIRQAVPGTYSLLGQTFVHPDNNYVSVRRWVSGVDGNIVISGSLSRQATNTGCILFRVFVDDHIVLSELVASGTPLDMTSPSIPVTTGSVIDFAVFAYDGIDGDGTNFQATIYRPEVLTFLPGGPDISGPTDITIHSEIADATVYYTTDGTTPTPGSSLYTGPVTVSGGTTLKAMALVEGHLPAYQTMTFELPTIPIVAWFGIPPEKSASTLARFQELREAGFTHNLMHYYESFEQIYTALGNAQEAGIRLFVNPVGPADQFVRTFKDHPALEGYMLRDEPGLGDFASLATQVAAIQSLDEHHWSYIDLFSSHASSSQLGTSSYENYVDSFMSTVPVKVLSFNHYPITTSGITSDFYENLEIISKAARESGKPFWAFALSTAHYDYPVPTLTHLRFQMFSNLAYGAQGLQYFTYWQPGPEFHDAPIDSVAGTRTATWYVVQDMNQEIKSLSGVFLGAKVVGVGHTGAVIPSGTTRYTPSAPISSLTTQGNGAVVSKLLNGKVWYLAIVNRDINSTMTLNLTVDAGRGISKVAKDGTATALGSGSVQYTVDPGDIVILKWNAIPGDANLDDKVDVSDLGILAANYGTTAGATWEKGDFNNDGKVDVSDLGILAANYGTGTDTGTALDFNTDARAFGLVEGDDRATAKEEPPVTSVSGCGSAGLPLIAGMVLAVMVLLNSSKLRD